MQKPEAFQQSFIALRNIPYLCSDPGSRDYAQGGVLCQGQTVWAQYSAVPTRDVKSAAAYVEGIGIIALDPHWLVPASLVRQRSSEAG